MPAKNVQAIPSSKNIEELDSTISFAVNDAANLTNEVIFLYNVSDFKTRYERLISAQGYFAMAYVAKSALESEGKCPVNKLIEGGNEDTTPLIFDLFQGGNCTLNSDLGSCSILLSL
ncbi:hypothetical protein NPIL_320701 [Nephila pilipes]|uniref:Uncharacterized protein n=1 Tax=Nephila pilipes TaxID=299642 RepID=A0A8X6NBY6_NEPPI|nr:hypothetical protein NPIL_320701 [Nephila pilipes]